MLTSLERLQAIKRRIESGRQPWLDQLDELKKTAAAAQLRTPPTKPIYCGGYNLGPDGIKVIACDWVVQNGIDAYTFALLGYLTGDHSYSDKAIQFIMQWADGDFKGFDPAGLNAPLQSGWTAPWFANAAEILRYTYPDWQSTHTRAVDNLMNLLLPRVSDERKTSPGNWMHARIEAHMAIAIWKDDKAMFNEALAQWKNNTPSYFYIAKDGAYPPEPHNRDFPVNEFKSRWWWGAKNFTPGMTMETCRDIGHQDLGVRSIFYSMWMARTQGVDAMQGTDIRERLTTFLEVQAQWLKDRRDPPGICDAPIVFNEGKKQLLNEAQPIPYELAYLALATADKPLSKTLAAILAEPSTTATRWVRKWETLTHHFE